MAELERFENESFAAFEQRKLHYADYLRVQAKPWLFRDRGAILLITLYVNLVIAILGIVFVGATFLIFDMFVAVPWLLWVANSKRWD